MWTAALLWTADRTDGRRGEGPGMTTPPLAQVPVRSAAELTQRWADLLDPPVFAARSLWLSWLYEDGTALPVSCRWTTCHGCRT